MTAWSRIASFFNPRPPELPMPALALKLPPSKSDIIGCLPVSHAVFALAINQEMKPIGVTISLLILTEHVKDLPKPFKRSAQGLLYKAVAEKD